MSEDTPETTDPGDDAHPSDHDPTGWDDPCPDSGAPITDGGEAASVDILLAEDNPNDAEMTQRAFEKGKFLNELHVVGDGVEALAFLRKEGEYADAPRPNIILLDLEMPQMDGMEVLEALDNDPDLAKIPVVVLTSSEAERDVVESYKHNANAYLTKPVGYKEFQEIVRQIEEFWFDVVKLPPEE